MFVFNQRWHLSRDIETSPLIEWFLYGRNIGLLRASWSCLKKSPAAISYNETQMKLQSTCNITQQKLSKFQLSHKTTLETLSKSKNQQTILLVKNLQYSLFNIASNYFLNFLEKKQPEGEHRGVFRTMMKSSGEILNPSRPLHFRKLY